MSARIRVATLHRDAKLSIREISRRTSIPRSTVHDIVKRLESTGFYGTLRKGNCGRKRSSSEIHDRLIVRKSKCNPRLTAVDIKRETSTHLSIHSVRRRLIEGGRIAKRPIRKPLLTSRMMKSRFNWAKCHKHWTSEQWEKVSSILSINQI